MTFSHTALTRRELLRASLAASALLGTGSGLLSEEPKESDQLVRYHNPKSYDVEHTVSLINQGALITSMEMWLPIPFTYHEQEVKNLRITPKAPVYDDIHSQAKVARWIQTVGLPLPGGTVSLKASYQITAQETTTDIKALMQLPFAPYQKDKVYTVFTRPEQKIETELPDIRKQAQAIAGERRPAASIARDAYDWVLDRTKYQLIEGFGGAGYCLKNQHGECGDYSSLFVALCRAAGVPARIVTGFWAEKRNEWHVWAEFRLPSGEWIPVDGAMGDGGNAAKRDRHFGQLDNKRVALCRTADIRLKRAVGGHQTNEFLQVGGCWWTGKNIQQKPLITYVAQGKAV